LEDLEHGGVQESRFVFLRNTAYRLIGIGLILPDCAAMARNVLSSTGKCQWRKRKFKLIVDSVKIEKI